MKSLVLGFALLAGAPAVAQDTPPPPPGGGGMMRADANGDGVVTKDEALAQAAQRFDRMDTNHDGKLTRDELDRVGQRMRGMRGGGDLPPPPQPQ
ncbi:hypothetical protein [Sphingomonas sp.]|uniref:hypothetical protein n=1 Tax=Sphingomonas sp. TaxID=28214 RepID=UPI003B00E67E